MRVNFVRAASLTKATKKLVRVCVCACVSVRVCTCVCAWKREQETGVMIPNDFFRSWLLHWYKTEFVTFQNVNWLPFVRVPAAVWMENQPHYSGNTETAVGLSPRSVLQLFCTLPFYSDRSEKGEERLKKNLFNNSADNFSIFCHLKWLTLADWEIKRKHASTHL